MATNTISNLLSSSNGQCAKNLIEFLEEAVPTLGVAARLQKLQPPPPAALLESVIVPHEDFPSSLCRLKKPDQHEPLSSVLDHVIYSLIKRRDRERRDGNEADGRNILSQGYVAGAATTACCARPLRTMPYGVGQTHLNTSVDFLKSSPWGTLLHRLVGDTVFRALLLHTSIFLPILEEEPEEDFTTNTRKNHQNFFQLCGPPILSTLVPKNEKDDMTGRKLSGKKRKRGNRENQVASGKPSLLAPLQACVSRRSMLYSNAFIPSVGLPSSHILNGPIKPEQLLTCMVDLRNDKGKRRPKRWKRLRETGIAVCLAIFRKHQRCDYARLLQHYCPLPAFCQPTDDRLQVSLQEASAAFVTGDKVASFLGAVLNKVFPPEFWGTSQNLDKVIEKVKLFTALRRREDLPNKALLHGVAVNQFFWLRGKSHKNSRIEHAVTEQLVLLVLRWLFRGFLVPLVGACFHVTESEFSGKRVLYYRKPAWSVFRSLSMQKLLQSQYKEISREEAVNLVANQQMGLSHLRLLPKTTGVRPIAILSKAESIETIPSSTSDSQQNTQTDPQDRNSSMAEAESRGSPKRRRLQPFSNSKLSTNIVLSSTFAVLRSRHQAEADLIGAGLMGLTSFYPRYKKFLQGVKPTLDGTKKLMFGSVDIQKCYDNINQDHLLEVVDQLLTADEYVIRKFRVSHPYASMGRTYDRPHSIVCEPGNFEELDCVLKRINTEFHGSVIRDAGSTVVMRKGKIMEQLQEHLKSHLLVCKGRYTDRYLCQRKGIPQGSVLSSLLCNYYYGSVEKKLGIKTLINDQVLDETSSEASVLARMIDDFLVITTNHRILEDFLRKMMTGDQDLGVQVNKDKTQVSVPVRLPNCDKMNGHFKPVGNRRFFPWCGMLFDTATGEVRIDYSRFTHGKAEDNTSVDLLKKPSDHLGIQLKIFVRPRCLAILFDPLINSSLVQGVNFYQMFFLAALKLHEYLKTQISVGNATSKVDFVLECVHSTIMYAIGRIRERLQQAGTLFDEAENDFVALGWTAMKDVFSKFAPSSLLSLRFKAKGEGKNQWSQLIATRAKRELKMCDFIAPA